MDTLNTLTMGLLTGIKNTIIMSISLYIHVYAFENTYISLDALLMIICLGGMTNPIILLGTILLTVSRAAEQVATLC